MEPLQVVYVSLRGGKKHRDIIISKLTCLCDTRATDIIIKIWHTKPYEYIMNYNKVGYITAEVTYCTTHNDKVPFLKPDVSISKIILHRFYIDKN